MNKFELNEKKIKADKKRDFYLVLIIVHLIVFPIYWAWTIAFFELWAMWITLSLIPTGFFCFFKLIKYDNILRIKH